MMSEVLEGEDYSHLLGDQPVQQISRTVTEAELSEHWGVSTRQVRMLAEEKVIERLGRNRYSLADSTRRYIRHLIAVAGKRGTADPELRAEKLRLTREQADTAALKNAAARRELIPAAEIEAKWVSILTDVRAAMLAIPGRLAGRINLPAADITEIDAEIRLALMEAGNADAR